VIRFSIIIGIRSDGKTYTIESTDYDDYFIESNEFMGFTPQSNPGLFSELSEKIRDSYFGYYFFDD
jgi:hypothetical protein